MRVELNECYVLHYRNFRESSLLLEVFSKQHGRLPVIHRGARKPGKRRGAIQPFQLFLFSWGGRGEIVTMRQHEAIGSAVLTDSKHYLCGFYMNELLHRLLHRHESYPELFVAYDNCLRTIAGNSNSEQELRYFELKLLNALGYGPTLEHDTDGNPLVPGQRYCYLAEHGPVPGDSETGCVVSGRTLQQLAHLEQLDSTTLREAKLLMRSLLQHQMQGQVLASQELYKSYIQAGNREQL